VPENQGPWVGSTYLSLFGCRTFCAESQQQLSGEAASMSLWELIVNENLFSTNTKTKNTNRRAALDSEWLFKWGAKLRKEAELCGFPLAPRRSRSGENTKA